MPQPEFEHARDRKLTVCPPVSANSLLGLKISDHYHLPIPTAEISFYQVRGKRGRSNIAVFNCRLGGRQINQLLHTIKPPDASYGMDTPDLVEDWQSIDSPTNKYRRFRHEAMGQPWFAHRRDKFDYLSLILSEFDNPTWKNKVPGTGVVPVLRWREENDGWSTIIYDRLTDCPTAPYTSIVAKHMPKGPNGEDQPHMLKTTAGIYALAYLAPSVRRDKSIWKPDDSYGSDCKAIPQNMGTTQVAVMALRYANALLPERFIQTAQQYIAETGQRVV